jgi:hypothetical protein
MRLRSFLAGLVVFGALMASAGSTALPAFACSCMPAQPIEAYKGDSNHMIFTGTVMAATKAGVDVAVEQWFQGPNLASVTFGPDGFGDQSAACQDPLPRVGSRWLWIAFVGENGQPGSNSCTPKWTLDSPEGDTAVADATRAFGVTTPATPPPTDPPPAAPVQPATADSPIMPAAIAGGVALAAVVLFGAVALIARRRGPRAG